MAKVVWGEDLKTRLIRSEDELRGLLEALHREAIELPFIADVVSDDDDTLAIGLGRERSILSFTPASLDPPYFASEGSPPDSGDGTVVFDYHGAYSEFPAWQEIPISDAIDAASFFVTSKVLPRNVRWREV